MSNEKQQLKKESFPINKPLRDYLDTYKRLTKTNVFYEDLLRFQGAISVFDKEGKDTLWVRVYYNEYERAEIDKNLKKIYTLLHSDGNESSFAFLNVDQIDFCTFGNSKPFRIKVRNILNDNYTHFYIKKADASRIYGLELEHILSPNRINYLVFKDTLIEEHIVCIPGDVFIEKNLKECTEHEKAQIAKQFVKFNERCMIGLLGDMRSYNFVIIPIYDFDQLVFKIRAIDFDQQCYEGNFKVYRPQFFKENYPMIKLIKEKLEERSIIQYKDEERAILAKRIHSAENRIKKLLNIMCHDTISTEEHLNQLKMELYRYTNDMKFKNAKSMGHIMHAAFEFITRNFKNTNLI